MEVGFDTIFGWQAVLFGLGVYIASSVLRRILEGSFRKYGLATARYWRDVLLPILPPLLGLFLGWVGSGYPYPAALTGKMSHALFGLVCGFSSGLLYRVFKGLMVKQWGIQLEELPRPSGDGVKPDGGG